MLITTTCPKCGGRMEVDDSRERIFCTYCGTEIINTTEKVEVNQNINVSGTVTHQVDRSDDPNLLIFYQSSNVGVQTIVRVVNTGQKYVLLNGSNIELHLPEGQQQLVLKIGKINYNRTVYIQKGKPVRVYATWNGHAGITIDQPHYVPVVDNSPQSAGQNNNVINSGTKNSPFGIVGFILSFFPFLSFASIVLGILDLVLKKGGRHGLAIAGLIIGGVMSIYTIIMISNMS